MQSKEANTRADVVRQRRTNRPRKTKAPVSSRRAPKAKTPAQPPVLIRGGLPSAYTPDRRRGKQAKRRYDVALSTPGAEMRLPSLPRLAIGWRLLSGLLVVGLASLIYMAWTDPVFQVTAIQVRGLQRLDKQDITAVTGIVGEPIFLVQPEKIQQDLKAAFPELARAAVAIKIPTKVEVEVVERQPIIAWVQDEQTLWVDASGVAFPPRGEDDPSIRVEALNWPAAPTSESDPELGKAASQLLSVDMVNAIQSMDEEAPKKTPLVYDSQHGLGWKDSRGWEAYFGTDVEDIDMKLYVYKAIVKRLKKDHVRPELISVEFVHAPFYRLER